MLSSSEGVASGVDSDLSPEKPGFDTLDELAEKDKFFQVCLQYPLLFPFIEEKLKCYHSSCSFVRYN